MISLRQSSIFLANLYNVEEAKAHRGRRLLGEAGMLPTASGRDIPELNPNRTVLLLFSMFCTDVDRIGDLVDAPAYSVRPGDDTCGGAPPLAVRR